MQCIIVQQFKFNWVQFIEHKDYDNKIDGDQADDYDIVMCGHI